MIASIGFTKTCIKLHFTQFASLVTLHIAIALDDHNGFCCHHVLICFLYFMKWPVDTFISSTHFAWVVCIECS